MNQIKKISFVVSASILAIGLLIPQHFKMPVSGASKKDYNQNAFWYFPWGKSGTHKGVDIFSPAGTLVLSSTSGIVLFSGNISMGGNIVLVLGPKWRLHYYAHLKDIRTETFSLLSSGDELGTVGNSGNAQGKPSHLHYSIVTLIPYFHYADSSPQGWKKIFYMNPIPWLNQTAVD